jgi:hypothetical protein
MRWPMCLLLCGLHPVRCRTGFVSTFLSVDSHTVPHLPILCSSRSRMTRSSLHATCQNFCITYTSLLSTTITPALCPCPMIYPPFVVTSSGTSKLSIHYRKSLFRLCCSRCSCCSHLHTLLFAKFVLVGVHWLGKTTCPHVLDVYKQY